MTKDDFYFAVSELNKIYMRDDNYELSTIMHQAEIPNINSIVDFDDAFDRVKKEILVIYKANKNILSFYEKLKLITEKYNMTISDDDRCTLHHISIYCYNILTISIPKTEKKIFDFHQPFFTNNLGNIIISSSLLNEQYVYDVIKKILINCSKIHNIIIKNNILFKNISDGHEMTNLKISKILKDK